MRRPPLLALLILVAAPTAVLADAETDARALLGVWVKAQNDGDFAKYAALYDAKFSGVKRTSDGAEKKLGLAQWKKDRNKMFRAGFQVAADDASVKVTDKGATVSFLQRWRGGGYADHGTKVLFVKPDRNGELKIVKEELLSSTPGWENDPKGVLDATALVSPITMRVQAEGINPESGCYGVTFVMYLKDRKGKTLQRELGGGDLQVEGVTTQRMEPGDDPLYEFGDWCAGGADRYEIKKSGDAIIVRWKGEDEGSEDDPGEAGVWQTTLTVQLPPLAKVTAQ